MTAFRPVPLQQRSKALRAISAAPSRCELTTTMVPLAARSGQPEGKCSPIRANSAMYVAFSAKYS